jgi:hypothetical protein
LRLAIGALVTGRTPAKDGTARGEPLRLRGLGSPGLLLLERTLDASDVVRIQRRHVIVHLETERTDLGDQVLVRNPDLFRNLIHSHLLSGHSFAVIRDGVSTAFAPSRPVAFFAKLRISSPGIDRRNDRANPPRRARSKQA